MAQGGALTWSRGAEEHLSTPTPACYDLQIGDAVAVCPGRHLTRHSKGLHRRWRSDQKLEDRQIGSESQVADTQSARTRWRSVS